MSISLVPPQALAREIGRMLSGAPLVICPTDGSGTATLAPVPEHFTGLVVGTSGSTGPAKMAMLSRRALVSAATMAHERLGGPGVWASALPTHYVAGLMTIVRSQVGGRPHVSVDPSLADLPEVSERAYLSIVPTQLHRGLVDKEISSRLAHYAAVLVGGAGLDDRTRARAFEAGIQVVETYGMTETCGGVVYDGVALSGVDITIVDDQGAPASQGRILLNSPTLFDGYLGDPGVHQGPLLTCDRGRIVDGRLDVLGRIDEVVLVGGVNVDLGQLQRLLDRLFPLNVACFAVPNLVWGSTIVVASSGPSLDTIRESLIPLVSPQALPRAWVGTPALARLESGKLDRSELVNLWRSHGEPA